MNCIIADDSKIMRLLLSKIVSNLGYSVVEAENGDDLLRYCLKYQPDWVISDWELPLLDGIDALYSIRNNKQIRQPIFFFCTYIRNTDIMRQALDSGADDFIIRPFDEDVITSKLKIALLNREIQKNA